MRTFIDVVLACGVIGWFVYPFFTTLKLKKPATSGQAAVDNGQQEHKKLNAHHYPASNIDGTPMVCNTMVDINGNSYGITDTDHHWIFDHHRISDRY